MSYSKAVVLRKNNENDGEDLQKPNKNVASAINKYTKNELNSILGQNTGTISGQAANIAKQNGPQYIKYTPNQQGNGHNSGAGQRVIKMHTMQVDPIMPAGFKHKRIPGGPGSPPATINHSPPRKLTAKDMNDWKIPPCISNWKNAKGYTIPLEMRISADGRTMQNHTVNEKFAQLADTFYLAERQARTEIEERIKIQKSLAYKDYVKKEQSMREAAQQAREEKNRLLHEDEDTNFEGKQTDDNQVLEEKQQREEMRYIRKREIEREKRLEQAGNKKSKQIRDNERDIGEKIALGQAQPNTSSNGMFDQRLFNQNAGLSTGFGDEDEYKLYDKPLFQDRTAASIYKNLKNADLDEDDEESGQKTEMEKVLTKVPKRGFEGAEKAGSRTKPVEFEKHEDDTFAMGSFVDQVKKKVKKN